MTGSTTNGRFTGLIQTCAGLALLAAVIAAALRIATPYQHGIWLVAYLFLVGFLALYLIGIGQERLAGDLPSGAVRAEAALWMLGVVTVPLGVLADVRALVAFGSVVLLAALFIFWRQPASGSGSSGSRGLRIAYLALLLFMAASVVTGYFLSSGTPWF